MEKSLKCKVIMLPTDKESRITKHVKENKFAPTQTFPYPGFSNGVFQNYFLYFVSNRKPNDGDLIMRAFDHAIIRDNVNSDNRRGEKFYKIEAVATDDDLAIETDTPVHGYFYMNRIPESFLEKFVDAEGKIDEVQIEMESYFEETDLLGTVGFKQEELIAKSKVKTNSDHTVIICDGQ